MINLNYLLLNYLQEKQTKEQVIDEITHYLMLNDPKINNDKELKSWLTANAKKRAVFGKSGKVKDYQVFTDSAILWATTNHKKDIEISNDFPQCDKIMQVATLSGGVKFSLRQLYNASQLVKNEAKECFIVAFKDFTIKLQITTIEHAYKISGIKEATLKVDTSKELSPIYLSSNSNNMLIITPCRFNDDEKADFYVNSEGSLQVLKSDDLLAVKVEAKKEVEAVKVELPKAPQPKQEATKKINYFAKVRGLNDNAKNEKATDRQINYLIMLTGRARNEFDSLSKLEASKMITDIKTKRVAQAQA